MNGYKKGVDSWGTELPPSFYHLDHHVIEHVCCTSTHTAKRSAGAYASDFYAGLVLPPGTRRGPQYCVNEEADIPACSDKAALFTPPQKCAVARHPEQRPRLPRLWVCAAHQHKQCASCAAVGRGVRHCCARGHAGHPRPTMALRGQQRGARRAEAHTPRAGGTPSAKRHRRQRALALGPDRVRPHKRGRVDASPPPPLPRGCAVHRQALPGTEEQGQR